MLVLLGLSAGAVIWVTLGQPCSGSRPTSLIAISQSLMAVSHPQLYLFVVMPPRFSL